MELSVGDIIEGKVTGIQPFGAFVDLGDGKSGMVHISEVANTFVSEIKDFIKENDIVKVKILAISDEGKISLSIKKAMPKPAPEKSERQAHRTSQPRIADPTYEWTPKSQSDSGSFEEMMNRFKQTSDEKFSELKRKNPESARTKRRAGARN